MGIQQPLPPNTVLLPVEWPRIVGCDLFATEVAYCLNYPLSLPGQGLSSLDQRNDLKFVQPMLDKILEMEPQRMRDEYVYLTVKRMIVGPGIAPNRPGWHSDGFGSDDLNFIWYDCLPTLFCMRPFIVSTDDQLSLEQFEEKAELSPDCYHTFPPYSILRLTQNMIHRVQMATSTHMRTFVKVTISKQRFNLEGNSTNPALPRWPMVPRQPGRNMTTGTPIDDHVEAPGYGR